MLKTKIHHISVIFSKQAPFYQNRVDFSDHAFWEKVTQAIENYQECVIIGREHPLKGGSALVGLGRITAQ